MLWLGSATPMQVSLQLLPLSVLLWDPPWEPQVAFFGAENDPRTRADTCRVYKEVMSATFLDYISIPSHSLHFSLFPFWSIEYFDMNTPALLNATLEFALYDDYIYIDTYSFSAGAEVEPNAMLFWCSQYHRTCLSQCLSATLCQRTQASPNQSRLGVSTVSTILERGPRLAIGLFLCGSLTKSHSEIE